MNPELDPDLARCFARAHEPLADDVFMANLLPAIEQARRTRLRRQILAIVAVVIVVSLNGRLAVDAAAAALRVIGEWSPAYADLLITPWGWAVSTLIGLWVLLRTRPSRR